MRARTSGNDTITARRAPRNLATGVAYPLADAKVTFDSGELRLPPPPIGTPAANRNTWKARKDLQPGTYTYY